MADFVVPAGATDVTLYVYAQDPTTGEGKTGLAFNTAGLSAYYIRPRTGATAISLVTQTPTGAHTDGGFVAVDGTNMPGLYRVDPPDAASAAGEGYFIVSLKHSGTVFNPSLVVLNPLPDLIEGAVVTDGANSATAFEVNLAGTNAADYDNMFLLFRTGDNAGRVRKVATGGYSTGTGFITMDNAFPATPGNGDAFVLINQ